MADRTWIEYDGVRIDLAHVHPATRAAMVREAQHWIDRGQRPPLLTVKDDGVDVSEQPDRWPARVRNYRGSDAEEVVQTAERPAVP